MTTTIAGWAALLAFLDAGPAAAVEGLARHLALLLGEDRHPPVGDGEPDGFSGIARRGELERMLLSEWLIAEEEPLEFIRRLSTGEVGYYRRELRRPAAHERVVVLADTGPDQAGVPRLVHLAALVVLRQRADARGVPLALGVVTDPGGPLAEGPFPEQFGRWHTARSRRRPDADDLRASLALLRPDDHAWVLGAEHALDALGDEVPPRVHRLSATEAEWSGDGATSVDVSADGRSLRLPLPPAHHAVRLLRGEGIRRRVVPSGATGLALRLPRFLGTAHRVVCRSDRDDELVVIPFSDRATPPDQVRVRVHRFRGPVLAASVQRRRIVALVLHGRQLVIDVVGGRTLWTDTVAVDAAQLVPTADPQDVPRGLDALIRDDLGLLVEDFERAYVQLAGEWFSIAGATVERQQRIVAVAPTPLHEGNNRAWIHAGEVGFLRSRLTPRGVRAILGQRGVTAWEDPEGGWHAFDDGKPPIDVQVPADEQVIGATTSGHDGPMLLTQSAGREVLRLRGATARTLTWASGDIADVAVHPSSPVIAILRHSGVLEVFRLPSGERVTVLRAGTS